MSDDTKQPIRLADRSDAAKHWSPADAARRFLELIEEQRADDHEVDRVVITYSARYTGSDRNRAPRRTHYVIAGAMDVPGVLGLLQRSIQQIDRDHVED